MGAAGTRDVRACDIKCKRGMDMKKFKKGCALVIALSLSMTMAVGCGSKEMTGTLKDSNTATATDAADASDESVTGAGYETIDELIAAYAPDVKLGQYKGLEYENVTQEVTDEDVQEKVDAFVDGLATFDKDTESTAKDGDTVNIDFVGTVDGEEFDGGNTNGAGYDVTLGSGSFIDDFEEQIEGHKAGETFTVEVTFPEDYGVDDLNGKDAKFETTLNYVKVDVPVVYNDALVAANTDYKTTAEYEESVRKELEEDAADSALASAQNEVMTKALTNSVIDNVSTDEIQSIANDIISNIQSIAESYGIEYAQYIYYFYGYDDEDAFAEYVNQVSEETLKERMLVCAIADAENITVTDEETEDYLTRYAEENGVDVDTLKENSSDVDLAYNALAEKVMNLMMESAVATEDTDATDTTDTTTAAEASSEE